MQAPGGVTVLAGRLSVLCRHVWALRWPLGTPPLLIAGDAAAFVVSRALIGDGVTSYTLLLPITVGALAVAHAYRPRVTLSVLRDVPILVPSLLVALTVYYLLVRPEHTIGELLVEALVLLVVLAVLRTGTYAAIRFARIRGLLERPTVLLGSGNLTWELANLLSARREFGLRPVGVLDDGHGSDVESTVPWLGGYSQLLKLLVERRVTHVIVAFGSRRDDELVEALRDCAALRCTVFVVPRLYELWDSPHQCDEVWGIPLLRVRSSPDRTFAWRLKRALDVVVSALCLVCCAPLMMLTATAVRLELGRGVLFRQKRIGRHGRPFVLLKFRSLPNADPTETGTLWNVVGDPRLGPVGRFIRATSIDELPQLWNVLRGDMSLVGPRPERPYFVDRFGRSVPRYSARHRVPAGVTGWAQVHGLRGPTSIEDRVRFDNNYIQQWSLWGDLAIMLRTISHLVGAPRGLRAAALGAGASEPRVLGAGPSFPSMDDPDVPRALRVLRVLHVTQPTDGGVARCVLQYLVAAGRRGWTVALACPPGPLAAAAGAAGIEVFSWPATRNPGPSVLPETRALHGIIGAWRPDVVHLHSSKAGLAGRLAVRGRVHTLFQPHAWSFDAVTGPLRTATIWWERRARRWADRVICVSRGEQARGTRAGIEARYSIAVNGVDLAEFPVAGAAARAAARRDLGLGAGPVVVCAGRLCRQKGQDLLLDAWPQVLAGIPDAVLVLVGDGPDRQALQERAPAGTVFAGHAQPVRPWLVAADVVALPSRWEGHPLVLLEAMATGRAVVASDVTGVVETIGRDAGELVEPGDAGALAAALVRRLTDPLLAQREGAAGRRRVEDRFDATTTVDRVLDLTCDVVEYELRSDDLTQRRRPA